MNRSSGLYILLVLITISTPCLAQQFHLVKDLDTSKSSTPQSAGYHDATSLGSVLNVVNGYAYFTADDGVHGRELWRSNGTAQGTEMVADIYEGEKSSDPQNLAVCNNKIFFTANATQSGFGLWVTDGTAGRTTRLFSSNEILSNLTPLDTLLYFSFANKLYKTNGTIEGTQLAYDFTSSGGGAINWMTNIHGRLFFQVYNRTGQGGFGPFLWTSDGTAAGTFKVSADVIFPEYITEGPGNTFYFAGSTSSNDKRKLWRGNISTRISVIPVPGTEDITLADFSMIVCLNNALYFIGNAPGSEKLFYRYDLNGNSGPELLKTLTTAYGNSQGKLYPAGNRIYIYTGSFQADLSYQSQLWCSDGTAENTIQLKSNFTAWNFSNIDGRLFLTAKDSIHGEEPWISDGTVDGTVLFKDIQPGTASSSGGTNAGFTKVGSQVLFSAFNNKGIELWASDGTAGGTHLLKDINETTTSSGYVLLLNSYRNKSIFVGSESDEYIQRLWVSDGTTAGTSLVKDFLPLESYNYYTLPVRHDSIFTFGSMSSSENKGLYAIDVNNLKPRLIKDFSASKEGMEWMGCDGGYVYFFSYLQNTYTWTAWRSDGTDKGTISLASGNDQGNHSYGPNRMPLVAGNMCYFFKTEAGNNQLWRSDGTVAGTYKLSGTAILPSAAATEYLTVYNGKIFLTAYTPQDGQRIWVSDGTIEGTQPLPGDYNNPSNLTVAGGRLFFSADTKSGYPAIWSTDGSVSGAKIVKSAQLNSYTSYPLLTRVGGKLFFFSNSTDGNELWQTDGIAGNTMLIKNLTPGNNAPIYPYNSTYNRQVAFIGNKLFFSIQNQLWASDGTDTGTHIIDDAVFKDFSGFSQITAVDNKLWFNSSTYKFGSELYAGEVAPATLNRYTFTGNGSFDNAANWLEGQVPPEDIYSGMEIIIKPINGGEFILNQPLHFKGGKLTIAPGAKVTIPGALVTL